MRHLILISVLLLSAAVCFAQAEYPDPSIGTRPGAFSARSLSLGHTYLTDESGPPCVMGNPAGLAEQTTRWRFMASGNVSRIKETRKYPIYDAFNAVLTWNNYALNDNLYSKLDGGIAYRVPTELLNINDVESFVLSLSSFSAYSFDYNYLEEVRDRYASGGIMDRKLGDNKLNISGDLRTLSFGAATKLHTLPLSVGFAFNTLAGSWTYTNGVYYVNADSANIVDRVKFSNVGAPGEINFGGTWTFNERLKVGARALLPTGKYKFSRDGSFFHGHATSIPGDTTYTFGGDVEVKYPSRYSAGLQFRPASEFRPLLILEGEVFTWHDYDPAFNNTFEIRAGVEHQVVPGAPVRFGYAYTTSPSDKDHASSVFTAGIGFAVKKLTCDFGVELGMINYSSPDMFPQTLYGGVNRTDNDHVETDVFRGMLSLKYDL